MNTERASIEAILEENELHRHNTAYVMNAYDRLQATNAELLILLLNLTRWVGKGIADIAYSECVNPGRAIVDLERAEAAIRKAKEAR